MFAGYCLKGNQVGFCMRWGSSIVWVFLHTWGFVEDRERRVANPTIVQRVANPILTHDYHTAVTQSKRK